MEIQLPQTMMITEGFPDQYTAVQMHLHWGGWDLEASGSEHTMDGIRYMAEVHCSLRPNTLNNIWRCPGCKYSSGVFLRHCFL